MQILVFSDSHHDINSMIYVLETVSPDMVIHLGDNVHDAHVIKNLFPEITFDFVCGNCDFEDEEIEKTIVIENITLFITHGHRYSVKSTLSRLLKKGADEKADIILFGHTHKPYAEKENEMWAINPGSISRIYKSGKYPSYAQITIDNETVDCKIIERK